jgi:hypothetical protein
VEIASFTFSRPTSLIQSALEITAYLTSSKSFPKYSFAPRVILTFDHSTDDDETTFP